MTRALCALTVCVLLGCTVTETGNPPARPTVDQAQVDYDVDLSLMPDTVKVCGDPGAVEPPQGSAVLLNLDRTESPTASAVAPDGSFCVQVGGAYDEEYRLYVVTSEARSLPVDFQGEEPALTLTPSVRALGDCLIVEPALEIEIAAGSGSVRVHNGCTDTVSLAPPALRRADGDFELDATDPVELAPGAELTIEIRVAATAVADAEDVLFIEATSPASDRRPLSLFIR